MNKQRKSETQRGIEWTDYTWNPISGCKHGCRWHMPDGTTAICYAESVAEGVARSAYQNGFSGHYWKPKMLSEPSKVKTSSRIFVGSMADVFGHWVPSQQIEDVLLAIRSAPQHAFQMLTKNAIRSTQFDLPRNVWLGSSSPPDVMWGKPLTRAQQTRMLTRALESLEDSNAAVKWMSFEPLSWDVAPIIRAHAHILDWAVIGAASNGRNLYPPDEKHVIDLVRILDAHDIPVFFKGNLKSLAWAKINWREDFPDTTPTQMNMF